MKANWIIVYLPYIYRSIIKHSVLFAIVRSSLFSKQHLIITEEFKNRRIKSIIRSEVRLGKGSSFWLIEYISILYPNHTGKLNKLYLSKVKFQPIKCIRFVGLTN